MAFSRNNWRQWSTSIWFFWPGLIWRDYGRMGKNCCNRTRPTWGYPCCCDWGWNPNCWSYPSRRSSESWFRIEIDITGMGHSCYYFTIMPEITIFIRSLHNEVFTTAIFTTAIFTTAIFTTAIFTTAIFTTAIFITVIFKSFQNYLANAIFLH